MLPDLYKINGSALGDRVKGKINSYVSNSCTALNPNSNYMPSLHKEYVKHAKRLRQTEGVESQSQAQSADQYLDFYIPAEGMG